MGMLKVPGGTFIMGTDKGGEPDERPAHQVTVRGCWMDKNEVTNAQYLECVSASVCRMSRRGPPPGAKKIDERLFRPDHPVVGVSWHDAKAYCEWRAKRLPREAEWERAARGNDARHYVWGEKVPDATRHGVFANRSGATEPVGHYPEGAGPYGHLDLAGNVWEWMEDLYDPYAYRRPRAAQGLAGTCDEILAAQDELRRNGQQGFTGSNPIPTECERVLRGGAYNYPPPGLRATNRVHHPSKWRPTVAGIRCAKDL
ncbi:formylglycine-generating enzyme family protein [Myxococcota bacterium]